MIAKTLLILLSVGMLSTVSGCYDEPSRYDNRPSYQGSGQMIKPDAPTEREQEYRRQRRPQEPTYEQERLLRPDRSQ
jgi:hypothetical protein